MAQKKYKVIWYDDCREQHVSIVEAVSKREAEAKVFIENDNWADTCAAIKL